MNIEFKENQRFTQWWLWLILIIIGIIPFIGIIKQIFLKESFGSKPMSDNGLITYSIFSLALLVFVGIIKLKTTINKESIEMRFFPLTKKTIKWNEIQSAKVLNYGFVGGWGIRLWTGYGTVYNIKGNKGLALELKNGKKLLIGTQKESELKEFITQLNQ